MALLFKVSYGMDKRRRACRLEHPKIPFCCINHVTKLGNITASANAAAILTLTNHVAIRCLLVTFPFKKKTELFLFPVTLFVHHSACLLRYQMYQQ